MPRLTNITLFFFIFFYYFYHGLTFFDQQDFTEEQLREYKEYQAKEKAAIEERVKRKVAMEQERRALKAAAEDIATKVCASALDDCPVGVVGRLCLIMNCS